MTPQLLSKKEVDEVRPFIHETTITTTLSLDIRKKLIRHVDGLTELLKEFLGCAELNQDTLEEDTVKLLKKTKEALEF